MSAPDINTLLDDLTEDPLVQRDFELDPEGVAARYNLTAEQITLLREGDVEGLIRAGLAERHVQQMRVSW